MSLSARQTDPNILHLNSVAYRLFQRLYALYPCNVSVFLKKTYGSNSNDKVVFSNIIEPMLHKIRYHPLLITSNKDKECDKSRWIHKETHDILEECAQYSIDRLPTNDDDFEDLYQFSSEDEDEHDISNATSDYLSSKKEPNLSHFKPIQEHVGVEQDDADLEVMQINLQSSENLEQPSVDSERQSQYTEELIFKIKNSFKQANSRIRFISQCLPENNAASLHDKSSKTVTSHLSSNNLSRSCPLLFFCNDQTNEEINKVEPKRKSLTVDMELHSSDRDRKKDHKTKTTFNLMLKQPEAQDNCQRKNSSLKPKTCKSVDFTKEAHKMRHFHSNFSFGLSSSFTRQSSNEFAKKSPSCLTTSHFKDWSPHELLNQMMFINTESCLAPMKHDSIKFKNSVAGLKTRLFNNDSEFAHMLQNPAKYDEQSLRSQMALMYVQLLFERHQREAHVIRNRRLYKKSKECIELQEKYNALQEQLKLQEEELDKLKDEIKKKIAFYAEFKQTCDNQVVHLNKKLSQYQDTISNLEIEKMNIETLYKEEYKSLGHSYFSAQVELQKFLNSGNTKNDEMAKLEKENALLKNHVFIYAQMNEDMRISYEKNKHFANEDEKLVIDSLKYENEGKYFCVEFVLIVCLTLS